MRKAFTLIELLIVITIFIILSVITIPLYKKWKAVEELKSFTYTLSSEIAYGRDYSRKNGKRVIVAIVSDTVKTPQNWTGNPDKDPVLYLIFADNDKSSSFTDGDTVLAYGRTIKFRVSANTVGRECFGNTGKCIIFFPVGYPDMLNPTGYVELQSRDYPSVKFRLVFRGITGITGVEKP